MKIIHSLKAFSADAKSKRTPGNKIIKPRHRVFKFNTITITPLT